jgi:hypothetical protein
MGDDLKTLTVGKDGSGDVLVIAGRAYPDRTFRRELSRNHVSGRGAIAILSRGAYDGSGWAAFDDRGQTYRSADGI